MVVQKTEADDLTKALEISRVGITKSCRLNFLSSDKVNKVCFSLMDFQCSIMDSVTRRHSITG